jgi:phage protein D
MEETYAAVLQPYQVVTVQAGNTPVSGDYLIAKATHKITRANYSQAFELKRNARSSRFSAGGVNVPGGIF